MSTPDFPKRLPEKLKAIRERLRVSPDEFALRLGAKNGAEILSYENDTGELSVRMLFRYAAAAGIPFENIVADDRELWSEHWENLRSF
jgi:transcriptional regulator with XRE-family HTH domain